MLRRILVLALAVVMLTATGAMPLYAVSGAGGTWGPTDEVPLLLQTGEPVGVLRICNTATDLIVTYSLDSSQIQAGQTIREIAIAVGDSADAIPRDNRGDADPKAFPIRRTFQSGVPLHSETVSLSAYGLNHGRDAVVAAYATVRGAQGSSQDVWAAGERINAAQGSRSWATSFSRELWSRWIQVSAQQHHTLAIKGDGTLWAWGLNDSGQLGLGDLVGRTTPTQVGSDSDWASVSTGAWFSLAVKDDGTLWSWGDNYWGQLGLGDRQNRDVPCQVGEAAGWALVAAEGPKSPGYQRAFAIRADGTLWAWGYNGVDYQMGIGLQHGKDVPMQVGEDSDWVAVAPARYHTLGLKSDGTLWGWGNAMYCGFTDVEERAVPTPRMLSDESWQYVNAYNTASAAIKSDGTLWTWGLNGYLNLGHGDSVFRYVPTQVGADSDWKRVWMGQQHGFAVKDDGSLWGWGSSQWGQLGMPRIGVPAKLSNHSDWAGVSTGFHTAGLKSDGTLWTWGYNTYGQLGLGEGPHVTTPTRVR